jgi:hypothetical protein
METGFSVSKKKVKRKQSFGLLTVEQEKKDRCIEPLINRKFCIQLDYISFRQCPLLGCRFL